MIVSSATRYKMRRVHTLVDSGVPVSTIEISMMAFSLPQLPALLTEVEQLGPLPGLFLRELSLRMLRSWSSSHHFPRLYWGGEAAYGGYCWWKVRHWERWPWGGETTGKILTISLDISMMSDESYNRYLALTSQMAFNVNVAPSRAERDVATIFDWFRGLFVFLCKRESLPSIMVTRKPNWSFRVSKVRDWLRKGKLLAPLVRPT